MTRRTDDTGYGKDYWDTLDGGAGYHDSVMWADIAHAVHEIAGVDKVAGVDRALSLRLLDVGCAFGFLLRHLRKRGYDVRGVDFSEYAVLNAPTDIQPYVSQYDLTGKDELTDWYKPFDIVTCFETLEHIDWQHAPRAIERLHSILKPGGLLIATICVVGQPDSDSDPTHVSVVPREWWEALFAEAGFVEDRDTEGQLRWFWLFSQHRGVFVLRRKSEDSRP